MLSHFTSPRVPTFLLGLILSSGLLSTVQRVGAQGLTPSRPISASWKDSRQLSQFKSEKSNLFSGRRSSVNSAKLQDYYKNFLLAKLTDPRTYGKDFAAIRRELTNDLTSASQSASLHNDMVQSLITEFTAILDANYHPATQVNAIILLAGLNSQERSLSGAPATPEKAAFPILRARLEKADAPLGIRLAALIGVLRHVESDWFVKTPVDRQMTAEELSELTVLAKAIIAQDKPTEGIDQAAHDYFRARTMDLFGSLASYTPSVDSLKFITDMVANKDVDMTLRSRAVFALGRQPFPSITNPDGDVVVGSVLMYVSDACQQVVDGIDNFREAKKADDLTGPAAGLGGLSSGGMNESGGLDGPSMSEGMGSSSGGGAQLGGLPVHEVSMIQRQILYHIFSADRAMEGTREIPGLKHFSADVAAFEPLQDLLVEMKKSVDEKDVVLETMVRDIKRFRGELEKLRPGASGKAAPKTLLDTAPLFN
jgi:uncharacterized membrane protein YgcG